MPSQFLSHGRPCQPPFPWLDCWAWHHMLWEISLVTGGQLLCCVPSKPPVHPQLAGTCWQGSVQRREDFGSHFQLPKASLSTSWPFPQSHEQAADGHSFGQQRLCLGSGWNRFWPIWGQLLLTEAVFPLQILAIKTQPMTPEKPYRDEDSFFFPKSRCPGEALSPWDRAAAGTQGKRSSLFVSAPAPWP